MATSRALLAAMTLALTAQADDSQADDAWVDDPLDPRALAPAAVPVLVLVPAPPRPPTRDFHNYIFGSAIALLMNRVSIGYELMPRKHHAIGLSGYGMILGITHGGPNVAKGTVLGGGGELGYRYYAGENGASGPFLAISAMGGYYHSRADIYELKDATAVWYKQYGAAIDLGWAFHLDVDTVLALSIGAQRTWVDERGHLSDLAQLLAGEGVRPRAQLLVGRVF